MSVLLIDVGLMGQPKVFTCHAKQMYIRLFLAAGCVCVLPDMRTRLGLINGISLQPSLV